MASYGQIAWVGQIKTFFTFIIFILAFYNVNWRGKSEFRMCSSQLALVLKFRYFVSEDSFHPLNIYLYILNIIIQKLNWIAPESVLYDRYR